MADKTTTLTTQTGDSIYPNVLDENIPDTIARVSDVNKLKTDVETDYVSKTYGDGRYATIIQLGGASIQSVDAYGEGGATTIEKGKIATDLTGVELKIPFVLNIYEDNTLSGVPTRIVMSNKFGENNYLGTLDFLNHYLVNVVKGTDGKYSYSSNIIPNPTKNTLFNKSILVPQDLEDPTPILPCTTADNGKVLSVVNGEANWAKIDVNSYPYITGRINASDTQTSTFPKTDSETRVVTIENLDLSKLLNTRTIIVDADADASEVFNMACGAYGETEGIGTYVSSISCDKKTNNLFFFYINMDTQTGSFVIKRKTIPTSTTTITFEN